MKTFCIFVIFREFQLLNCFSKDKFSRRAFSFSRIRRLHFLFCVCVCVPTEPTLCHLAVETRGSYCGSETHVFLSVLIGSCIALPAGGGMSFPPLPPIPSPQPIKLPSGTPPAIQTFFDDAVKFVAQIVEQMNKQQFPNMM